MRWYHFVILCSLSLAGSYAFALAGAPQQVWLWRDVLGLI